MPESRTNRRNRAKGYTQNKRVPDLGDSMPSQTCLTGIVGTVPKLYDLIDASLQQLDWNWVTLAKEIPCSRQHLERLVKRPTIPSDIFLRICAVLGINPEDVITATKLVE